LGRLLIGKAKALAKEEGFRELVLETQSCNIVAMDFYESCGFVVTGIDLSCYSNDDVTRNEVRVEMTCKV
jgi:ribosomal protein S18 acetylase RimI-like enzyme